MNFPIIEDRSTAIPSRIEVEIRETLPRRNHRCTELAGKPRSVDWKQGTESILVLHFSAFEFADEVYRWAKENYLIGDVETIEFISGGKSTGKHETRAHDVKLTQFVGHMKDRREELGDLQLLPLAELLVALLDVELLPSVVTVRGLLDGPEPLHLVLDLANGLVAWRVPLSVVPALLGSELGLASVLLVESTVVHLRAEFLHLSTSLYSSISERR
ncbi:unnamed protein product [Sphagnum balticum]